MSDWRSLLPEAHTIRASDTRPPCKHPHTLASRNRLLTSCRHGTTGVRAALLHIRGGQGWRALQCTISSLVTSQHNCHDQATLNTANNCHTGNSVTSATRHGSHEGVSPHRAQSLSLGSGSSPVSDSWAEANSTLARCHRHSLLTHWAGDEHNHGGLFLPSTEHCTQVTAPKALLCGPRTGYTPPPRSQLTHVHAQFTQPVSAIQGLCVGTGVSTRVHGAPVIATAKAAL